MWQNRGVYRGGCHSSFIFLYMFIFRMTKKEITHPISCYWRWCSASQAPENHFKYRKSFEYGHSRFVRDILLEFKIYSIILWRNNHRTYGTYRIAPFCPSRFLGFPSGCTTNMLLESQSCMMAFTIMEPS